MDYKIKLETFEGPFDLLFHLIEKNEIDIYNIPISKITSQYLDYVDKIKELDMEIASEFLVMAATLLEIKSKMLLPNPVEEQLEFDVKGVDPRRDLVMKLIEYKKYKDIAELLKHREEVYGKVHFKPQDDLEEYVDRHKYKMVNLKMEEEILIKAVKKVLNKASRMDNNRKKFFKELKREVYTVDNKINLIKERLNKSNCVNFLDLVNTNCSKLEIIVTFLALLELLKLKVITIKQESLFEDIYIYRQEGELM
ncbi:MAG: segregation and condensation protein [Candidatus Petromonas sp.]|jgi:segregation and condensation protein A|nr:segregation and condensation protein [Candidatus Petromonas sp.]